MRKMKKESKVWKGPLTCPLTSTIHYSSLLLLLSPSHHTHSTFHFSYYLIHQIHIKTQYDPLTSLFLSRLNKIIYHVISWRQRKELYGIIRIRDTGNTNPLRVTEETRLEHFRTVFEEPETAGSHFTLQLQSRA